MCQVLIMGNYEEKLNTNAFRTGNYYENLHIEDC